MYVHSAHNTVVFNVFFTHLFPCCILGLCSIKLGKKDNATYVTTKSESLIVEVQLVDIQAVKLVKVQLVDIQTVKSSTG